MTSMLDRIPSEVIKLNFWTEITLSSFIHNKSDYAKEVYNTHILPLVDSLIRKKNDIADFIDSLTAVYLFNPDQVKGILENTSSEINEDCYFKIAEFFVTNRNPFDYYDPMANSYKTQYGNLLNATSAVTHLKTDNYIFRAIVLICDSVKASRSNLTKPQIGDIFLKLKSIVEQRLPDTRNIKHEGYKLLCNFRLVVMRKENIEHNTVWQKIIQESNEIKNISDKVFVKKELLDNIPFDKISNGINLRNQLFDDIIECLNAFISHYEFIERVVFANETMYNVNRTKWKGVLQKAFDFTSELSEVNDSFTTKRTIIDAIYTIDKEYAKEIVENYDKNNSTKNTSLKKYYDRLEISNKIKNSKDLTTKELENRRTVVFSIYKALESLNSEKIVAKKINETSIYLPVCSKLSLSESLPIFYFYLANCAKQYKTLGSSGALQNIHEKNFNHVVNAMLLIEVMAKKNKAKLKLIADDKVKGSLRNKIIQAGSKDEAYSKIQEWLQDEMKEYLFIIDPYFSIEDLYILKIVLFIDKKIDVEVLGSNNGWNTNIEPDFKNHWKKSSDEESPYTNFTFAWVPEMNNQSPFHDRYLLTKNNGLRLGSSLNSIGVNKVSEISVLGAAEAFDMYQQFQEFFLRKKKDVSGSRISYNCFNF